MNKRADVAVVVVGINSREYVRACLASLQAADWKTWSRQIVYVDNGSADGSVEMVRREFPGTRVRANARNAGFCTACNQAVREVDSRYVYLLNNDTIAGPDSVWPLVEFLERTPGAAAAGNRLLNPDLTDQWSARRFPTWIHGMFGRRSALARWFPAARTVRDYLYKEEMVRGEPFEVDWVPGSCTMVRRDAYLAVGGLPDEMHYWSDAVFCARLRAGGGSLFIVPRATLVHDEGHGTGAKSSALRRWLIVDFHKGAYRFYCEHYTLGPWHPARWLARTMLESRARVLIAADAWHRRGRVLPS